MLKAFGAILRIQQYPGLGHKLNIHEAAGILLDIKAVRLAGKMLAHFFAHFHHLGQQFVALARPAQNLCTDSIKFRLYTGACGRHSCRLFTVRADTNLGDKAGANQRLMLPGPGLFLLVGLEGGNTADHQPGLAVRAQAGIGFVENTRIGAGIEKMDDALSHARKKLLVIQHPVAFSVAGGELLLTAAVMQKDNIQVRIIAQLVTTQLAIGDNGHARLL